MNIFGTLEAQCRRSLLILFVAGLVFWSSLASMLPNLAPYIEDLGGSKQEVGKALLDKTFQHQGKSSKNTTSIFKSLQSIIQQGA